MKNNHLFIFIGFITLACGPKKTDVLVSTRRVADLIYAVGTVKSEREISFRTGIYCHLDRIYVKEGAIVAAGAPLFQCEGTTYRAPFAAQVTDVLYREGENIVPGTPALNLIDSRRLYVQAVLDQHSAYKVRPGQKAFFVSEIFPGGRKATHIESIFPRNDRFLVRLKVDELAAGVLPGMTLDAIIEVAVRENTPVIPIKAAMSANRFLCNGKEKRQVALTAIDAEWAEIVEKDFDYTNYKVCS